MPNIKVICQTVQPWECPQTDGPYQVHYLPRFAVDPCPSVPIHLCGQSDLTLICPLSWFCQTQICVKQPRWNRRVYRVYTLRYLPKAKEYSYGTPECYTFLRIDMYEASILNSSLIVTLNVVPSFFQVHQVCQGCIHLQYICNSCASGVHLTLHPSRWCTTVVVLLQQGVLLGSLWESTNAVERWQLNLTCTQMIDGEWVWRSSMHKQTFSAFPIWLYFFLIPGGFSLDSHIYACYLTGSHVAKLGEITGKTRILY